MIEQSDAIQVRYGWWEHDLQALMEAIGRPEKWLGDRSEWKPLLSSIRTEGYDVVGFEFGNMTFRNVGTNESLLQCYHQGVKAVITVPVGMGWHRHPNASWGKYLSDVRFCLLAIAGTICEHAEVLPQGKGQNNNHSEHEGGQQ